MGGDKKYLLSSYFAVQMFYRSIVHNSPSIKMNFE
jgi:hypothetical protein